MPSPQFLQPKKILRPIKDGPHPQFLNDAFVDPYRGCEIGCLYCYGNQEEIIDRGEGPSPFRIGVKTSCAFSLKKELPGFFSEEKKTSIGLGFASDPYQPCESQFQLTRNLLEILKGQSCPVQVITKSDLVLKDKELLSELSQKGLAIVSISLFTLNKEISNVFEPRALPTQKRLELIQQLRNENIVCGAVLMPIFPYLTDSAEELDELFSTLHSHGALYCVPGILSLAHGFVKKRIFKIINGRFPKLFDQYQALYDTLGHPALNYCQRIEKTLHSCSDRYQIPTVLPVEGLKKNAATLIVKDSI